MNMRNLYLCLVFSFVITSAANADQAAGNVCAGKLSPDAKKIFDKMIASGPTSSNAQSLIESTTNDLASKREIDGSRALRSGGDAWDCIKIYLK